jgi:hypothetical protein
VLATLQRAQGVVEADTAAAPVSFERAAIGRTFRLGDAVRTAASARADLTLARGGRLRVDPSSLVRFSARPDASEPLGFGVEFGSAVVAAPTSGELAFSTVFGTARVAAGSSVRLSGGANAGFEVIFGSAQMVGDGGTVTLSVGDRFVVEFGSAVVERAGSARARDAGAPVVGGGVGGAAAVGAAPVVEGAAGTSGTPGAQPATGANPGETPVPEDDGIADFSLAAGENAAIHDLDAPTAVRFRFGPACTTGGTVELAGSGASFTRSTRASGRASATLSVPTGAHAYRVSCGASAPFATGTLRVDRDPGTAALPLSAPRSTVDADGRRYTVLYQTRLPELTLRWPRAPAAPGYVISVERAGAAAEETRSPSPEKAFPSGHFADGNYTFTFYTADRAAHTAPTSLRVDFNNATPAADIDAPPPTGPVAGGAAIAGTAGIGSLVSVSGAALQTERNGRFSGLEAPSTDERCLAIRVVHPQIGVHYFLRCGGS